MRFISMLPLSLLLAAAATAQPTVPLEPGLGAVHWPVSTKNAQAPGRMTL